ncbi:MAG: cell division protein FtsA [Bryobacteraceae bacterium]
MAKRTQIAAGLDLGSAWTRLVVLSLENGLVRYLTHAAEVSRGWHRGQIADPDAVAACVRQVFEQCERKLREPVNSAVVGVGGPAIRCKQGRGRYELRYRRRVQHEDIVQALKLAARTPVEHDQIALQVLPQDFTADGRPPIPHPLNVECELLEAHALIITAARQDHQAVLNAVQQAGVQVEETVFEAMAAAYACILPEERASGVALLDIGAHSSNLLFYDGDAMLFAAGLPVSGDHFTRDISTVHGFSYEDAERLKLAHGCAHAAPASEHTIIELPAEGGRGRREISRRELVETLEARAGQLFEIVESCRQRYARDLQLGEGLVLCGGGALLEGMVQEAERLLRCPARLGLTRGVLEWPEELCSPVWTAAAGLAMYSARLQSRRETAGSTGLFGLFRGK